MVDGTLDGGANNFSFSLLRFCKLVLMCVGERADERTEGKSRPTFLRFAVGMFLLSFISGQLLLMYSPLMRSEVKFGKNAFSSLIRLFEVFAFF